MNLNLSPVLDVYREEGNFDDEFGRSYSSDPAVVARLGAAFVTAQQRTGVAATAKHFPGLGAAAVQQNTDLVPVTLPVPLRELRAVDELPFTSAIRAGVQLVMTSWAVYPALDPRLPAGLSPAVIQGELRGRLRFRGVTITDALEAGSLTAYGTPAEVGVRAAQAGMDLLLCSGAGRQPGHQHRGGVGRRGSPTADRHRTVRGGTTSGARVAAHLGLTAATGDPPGGSDEDVAGLRS